LPSREGARLFLGRTLVLDFVEEWEKKANRDVT